MKKRTSRFLSALLIALLMLNTVGTAFASTTISTESVPPEQGQTVENPADDESLEQPGEPDDPDDPVIPEGNGSIDDAVLDESANDGEDVMDDTLPNLVSQENSFNINEQDVILSGGGTYTIFGDGTPAEHRIELSGGTFDITLDNVNIDLTCARDENDYEIRESALILKSGADVTLTIKEGTESTLIGGEINSAIVSWSSRDRNNSSGKYTNYIISSLTIQGNGTLNLYAGKSTYNPEPGIGISRGSDYGFQGPITFCGEVTVNVVGGSDTMGGSSGGGGILCGPDSVDSNYFRDWLTIKENATVTVAAGACVNDYMAPGIKTISARITDDSTVLSSGSEALYPCYFGGPGIDCYKLLIDGNATVSAYGNGGSPAISAYEFYSYKDIYNGVTISGNATVFAQGENSCGIGGGCDYIYGSSTTRITISENAKVDAFGGGQCKDFAPDSEWMGTTHSSYVFDIGNYCAGSSEINISGNAEVTASLIGGAGDSNVSISDDAKVIGTLITCQYEFNDSGDIITSSGLVKVQDNAMVMGGIKYIADLQLSGSALICLMEQNELGVPAAAVPRTTALAVFDCGASAVPRELLLDGPVQRDISLPDDYRGFICSVPVGDYTVSAHGFFYKDKDGNSSFPVVLTDDALETTSVVGLPATLFYNIGTGQSIPPQTIDLGARFAEPSQPSTVGYTFAGWYADAEMTIPFDFSSIATQDEHVYARWTPRNDTKYKVIYQKQNLTGAGYTTSETLTLTGTTDATVPAEAKDYTGFAPSGGQLPSVTIAANGTSVLTVKYDRLLYPVDFVTGNSPEMSSQTVRFESTLAGEDPVRPGYLFDGWYTDNTYQNMFKYRIGIAQDTWEVGDEIRTHIISTANDWDSFTSYVNNGGITEGHTFRLDNNIDFKNATIQSADKVFRGSFDGRGFTLSNFKISGPLFAEISQQATVENLGNKSAKVSATAMGDLNAALLAGRNDGLIANISAENCDVEGIQQSDSSTQSTFVGGLVAQNYGELTTSYIWSNEGVGSMQVFVRFPAKTVPNGLKMGGLVGYNEGTISACYSVVSNSCFIGGSASGNYIYFCSLVGLNAGSIQHTYWSYPYNFSVDNVLIKAYVNVSGDPVSGKDIYLGNDCSQNELANNEAYFIENAHLKLSSSRLSLATKALSLHAKWLPASNTEYAVKHYCQTVDGSSYDLIDTETMNGATGSFVNGNAKEYTGFVENLSNPGRLSSGTIAADGSLELALYYDRTTHDISFESNNGTLVDPQSDVKYGACAVTPVAPTKSGYTFAGWFNEGLTTEYDFTTPVTCDIILYAKWVPATGILYIVNHHTKNLTDSNYTIAAIETLSGATGAFVTVTPKSFAGFTVKTAGDELSGIIAPDGSLVINVYYERNNYTVTFNGGAGVAVGPQTVAYQSVATLPEAPVKSGYSFDGWFLDDKFESPYSWASEITSDITLFAKWTAISYPSATTYKISVIAGEGGTVSPKSATVSRNSNKTFTITPAKGYIISAIFVDGEKVALTTSYQFSKVVKNHTLEVQFEKHSLEHVCPSSRYTDINTTLWYHEAIDFALSQGIMNGYTDTTFAPKDFLTRAQFVAIIARASKDDLDKYTQSAFDDVTTSSWYGPAIQWAKESGITKGYSESIFAPEDKITREQFVVMLYREYKNDVSVSPADTTSFDDYTDISAWAKEAMDWAIAAELITGVEPKVIAPQSNITRAEAAQILLRLLSK